MVSSSTPASIPPPQIPGINYIGKPAVTPLGVGASINRVLTNAHTSVAAGNVNSLNDGIFSGKAVIIDRVTTELLNFFLKLQKDMMVLTTAFGGFPTIEQIQGTSIPSRDELVNCYQQLSNQSSILSGDMSSSELLNSLIAVGEFSVPLQAFFEENKITFTASLDMGKKPSVQIIKIHFRPDEEILKMVSRSAINQLFGERMNGMGIELKVYKRIAALAIITDDQTLIDRVFKFIENGSISGRRGFNDILQTVLDVNFWQNGLMIGNKRQGEEKLGILIELSEFFAVVATENHSANKRKFIDTVKTWRETIMRQCEHVIPVVDPRDIAKLPTDTLSVANYWQSTVLIPQLDEIIQKGEGS